MSCGWGTCSCPSTPVCTPNALTCSGTQTETCDACGQWAVTSTCTTSVVNATATCSGAGICGFACDSGYSPCSGVCTNYQTDPLNCGACGHSCQYGACSAGVCQPFAIVPNQMNPEELLVDSENLYWFSSQDSSGITYPIYMVNKSTGGAGTSLGSSSTSCTFLAIDLANVYWTEGCSAYGEVFSVPIDWLGGGRPTTRWAMDQPWPGGIAVDSENLYWIEMESADGGIFGGVQKMPLDGGAISTIASRQDRPAGTIALGGGNVYWADEGTNGADASVMMVPLDGGTVNAVVLHQGGNLTTDSTNVYWTNGGSGTGTVMMAPLDGVSTPTPLATGRTILGGSITTDGTFVYWTEPYSTPTAQCAACGNVMKVAISGGVAPVTLASGQDNSAGIAVDSTFVYWSNDAPASSQDSTLGAIMEVVKN
jgi:hypothetical protein